MSQGMFQGGWGKGSMLRRKNGSMLRRENGSMLRRKNGGKKPSHDEEEGGLRIR